MKSHRLPVLLPNHFSQSRSGALSSPAERWQHSGRLIEMTDCFGNVTFRASEENILDVLFFQKLISERQRDAALRLKADYMAADMEAHLSSSYSSCRVSSSFHAGVQDRSDAQEDAYQRWRGAIVAIGTLCNDIVITVACHDVAPHENTIPLLQVGLIRLAKWYGIVVRRSDDDVDQAASRQIGVGGQSRRTDRTRGSRLLH